ncbi:MAG: hypothetical protein RR257_02295 [Rikenellaceae bacterium]
MAKERKEVFIPIKGLNSRDDGYKLEDGHCSRMHNVSYRNGSWRKVGRFPTVRNFDHTSNTVGYKISYKHPILADDEFIAYYYNKYTATYRVSWVRVVSNKIEELAVLGNFVGVPGSDKIRYAHYGAMLIITTRNIGDRILEYDYIFYKGKYVTFDLSKIPPISKLNIICSITNVEINDNTLPASKIARVTLKNEVVGSVTQTVIDSFDPTYQAIYSQYNKQGYLHGALYIFLAYKLYDGTIVRNGDIFMVTPDIKTTDNGEMLYRYVNGNTHEYYMSFSGFKPTIVVWDDTINLIKDLPFVESIVIYATPCTQIYDIESVYEKYDMNHPKATSFVRNGKTYNSIRADVILDKRNFNVANKPFYEVAEIDFKNGVKSIELDYNTHFNNIENKPIYKPNFSTHDIASRGTFNFNGYLHRYSLSTKFFKGSPFLLNMWTLDLGSKNFTKAADPSPMMLKFIYTLDIDGSDIFVYNEVPSFSYVLKDSNPSIRYVILPNMITYPDARAHKLTIMVGNNSQYGHFIKDIELKPAPSNNYAYYQNEQSERVLGYFIVPRDRDISLTTPLPFLFTDNVCQRNKMIVSKKGNPYFFDPINTYSIGDEYDTEIVDINIPTDDVSESSFGNYPIYILTTTGIYAMGNGADGHIYASGVFINGDNVTNYTKSIAIAGKLFYLTNRGVTELNARNGIEISDILTGLSGYDNTTFEKYIQDAQLLIFDTYKELVLFNSKYTYAYVYSTEGKMWSTRDLKGTYIGRSLLYDTEEMYDLKSPETGVQFNADVKISPIHIERDVYKTIDEIEFDTYGGYEASVFGVSKNVEYLLKKGYAARVFQRLLRSWLSFSVSFVGEINYLNGIRIKYITKYKR